MNELIYYLIAVNIVTFLLFFADKRKAVKRRWRIPERVLLGFSAAGGAIGGYLSMKTFRHKTQTPIFKYGMPILIILQIAVILYFQGDLI